VQTCLADTLRRGNAKDRLAKVEELMEVLSHCTVAGVGGRTRVARRAGRHG
jgi:alkylhydroperoxidase/carboxymuconolactone decarboxylase family protein YurZ